MPKANAATWNRSRPTRASFSACWRKPDVDHIDGLSPAISIDQKGASRNPRSTVGTVTEVYDYLRLLFARIGVPHCPQCGREISQQTVQQMVDTLLNLPDGTRYMILAPIVQDRKGEYRQVFEDARKAGYVRVRVDGTVYDLEETPTLDRYKQHTIEIVVDRLVNRGRRPIRRVWRIRWRRRCAWAPAWCALSLWMGPGARGRSPMFPDCALGPVGWICRGRRTVPKRRWIPAFAGMTEKTTGVRWIPAIAGVTEKTTGGRRIPAPYLIRGKLSAGMTELRLRAR